jgi:hypothetical protein
MTLLVFFGGYPKCILLTSPKQSPPFSRSRGALQTTANCKGMSNAWQGSSFLPNTPTSVAEQSSNDASRSSTAPPPQISVPVVTSSSSHAGPSSARTPVSTFTVPFNSVVKRPRVGNWTAEEEEISRETATRFVPIVP